MKNLIVVIFAAIALSACTKEIYTVHSGDESKKGIPFLTKTVQLEQQTTYALSFYDVTMEVIQMKNDSIVSGVQPSILQSRRTTASDNVALKKLQAQLQKFSSASGTQLAELIDLYFELPELTEDPASFDNISNLVNRNIVVSEEMYYLNGNKSAFDTASMNFELNSDNTLTKGEASLSSDYSFITDVLTSVIPASDLISKVFKLDKEEASEEMFEELNFPTLSGDEEEISFRISLKITGGVVQYIFTKQIESYSEAEIPIQFSLDKGFFIRKEVTKVSAKSESADKKEDNAIKINGSIVFPEKE